MVEPEPAPVRSAQLAGFVAPKRSRIRRAHSRRMARNFAASRKRSVPAVKLNAKRGANRSTGTPRSMAACT